MIFFLSIFLVSIAFKDVIGKPHPLFSSVENNYVSTEYDCALRAFTVEMAGYIAPVSSKFNWTLLSQSALQMDKCNHTINSMDSITNRTTHEDILKESCQEKIFVHDSQGNDLFDGTFEKPMKTIQAALSHVRHLRIIRGNDDNHVLCITIRGGTYYLGTNATTSSSQIGAIALTSNDSNLVIENYKDEHVILSGGVRLDLKWSIHSQTSENRIMKAQIPSYVNVDQFNELYIDGKRAIVAKYPNGDPSTQGLYAQNPGFSYDFQRWVSRPFQKGIDIEIQQPNRNGTAFPSYHLTLAGTSSAFNPPQSFWGSSYNVPQGVVVKNGALPRLHQWSKPSTGVFHTFHGNYWGSWVFEIESTNSSSNLITFGRGGFQEARGSGSGGAFYVANIFEELDSPNEWFLDKDTRTLYFMPNGTMPNVFVASQIPCLISISGSSIEDSVKNILIQGLTLTQTSHTYMRDYMVPSGGDWAVHRGATIYLTNTKNTTIQQNLFTQLGSNGIALIDYNKDTSMLFNEFVWLADSAIILVGSTNGIDGYSVASQPTNTLIQSNLIHETGIYVKQSSPVLIAVSRSTSVVRNLIFNIPRAAININDGFYGNHTLSRNVIFNTVRETSDHGPINTWDRQPFLSDGLTSGVPSLWQHPSYIHHNTLINNYHSVWPLDHDDGSCFYEDSYNFLIYGGKKNFLGHSKTDHHQIFVYSDANPTNSGTNVCLYDSHATRGSSGWNEVWIENICTLYQSSVPYNINTCNTSDLLVPYLANNTIYIPSGTQVAFTCKVNGTSTRLTLEQWQALGLDLGTTIKVTPDVQTIIQWGRDMLQKSLF